MKCVPCTGLFEDPNYNINDNSTGNNNDPIPDVTSNDTATSSSHPAVDHPAASASPTLQHEETPSTPDVSTCENFYQRTCGCDKNQGSPCSKLFPLEHFIEMRAHCSLLTKDELDLVLMGFISSSMLDSDAVKDGRHQHPAKRRHITMAYKHHGVEVCKKTFLFLHGIGKDRLQNVKDHYKVEGMQVRINKNTKRSPHHAMSFAAIKYVVNFLTNYAEVNAIPLPGRIPGYKREDIKLLPSNRSKAVRHLLAYTVKITYTLCTHRKFGTITLSVADLLRSTQQLKPPSYTTGEHWLQKSG